MSRLLPRLLALLVLPLAFSATAAQALAEVEQAWARSSGPGQKTSGAYMRLTAREPLELLGVQSPLAGAAEVHEMKMEGDIMRMRGLSSLALPAGQAVELRPGGLHIMLMDLKQPLQPGMRVPITLELRDARGAARRLDIEVPVSARPPGPAGGARVGAEPHGHRH